MNTGLEGKTVLVVESVNHFGRPTAVAFAKEGANLVLASAQSSDALEETARQVSDQGVRVITGAGATSVAIGEPGATAGATGEIGISTGAGVGGRISSERSRGSAVALPVWSMWWARAATRRMAFPVSSSDQVAGGRGRRRGPAGPGRRRS